MSKVDVLEVAGVTVTSTQENNVDQVPGWVLVEFQGVNPSMELSEASTAEQRKRFAAELTALANELEDVAKNVLIWP